MAREPVVHVLDASRIVGVAAAVWMACYLLALLLIVLELIRKRRLKERYALLWLATGVVLLVLSLWTKNAANKTFEVINDAPEPQQSLAGYFDKLSG